MDDVEVHETREGHLIVRSRSTGLSIVGSGLEVRRDRTKVENACRKMLEREVSDHVRASEEIGRLQTALGEIASCVCQAPHVCNEGVRRCAVCIARDAIRAQ